MRPLVLSNCEKDFILQGFLEKSRLDGRSCTDYRNVAITLGDDRGSCLVVQGKTKVFAQVSCSVITPKAGRAAEGSLFVNLELSPMAAPHFESGRLGDVGVEICRLLERSLKQSRCLDLESLCIVVGEQVWEIRLDVHVLDYDGTIIDCASVAAVCALRHFRRPDVTVIGDRIKVHTLEEKEPIPLNLYHYPLCVTFGFCDQGKILIVDPTESEEQVIDGKIVVAMNSHQELCAVHCSGNAVFQKEQLLRCTSRSVQRAKELTDVINQVFEKDTKSRFGKVKTGFSDLIGDRSATGASQNESMQEESSPAQSKKGKKTNAEKVPAQKSPAVVRKGKVTRIANTTVRLPTENDDSDVEIISETATTTEIKMEDDDVVEEKIVVEGKKKRGRKTKQANKDVQSLLDEIEEDVQILDPADSGYKTASKPDDSESNAPMIDLTLASKSAKGKNKRNK